ncbi:hypothetical protein HanPSC8_Chr09g0387651 [Helianthus annuus]|nr:hypothetical protein HanPSC8_Chr09g0387651 [Helianthus annuus]
MLLKIPPYIYHTLALLPPHLLQKPISSLSEGHLPACVLNSFQLTFTSHHSSINCGTLPRLNKKNTKDEACDQDLGKEVLDVHVNPAKCTITTTAIHGGAAVAGFASSLLNLLPQSLSSSLSCRKNHRGSRPSTEGGVFQGCV